MFTWNFPNENFRQEKFLHQPRNISDTSRYFQENHWAPEAHFRLADQADR